MQINLHYSKAAIIVLRQKLVMGKADIALIQEPWIQIGQIIGLGGTFCFQWHTVQPQDRAFM
jgi:hypothetical protein